MTFIEHAKPSMYPVADPGYVGIVGDIWLSCSTEWVNHCSQCNDYHLPPLPGFEDGLRGDGPLYCKKCLGPEEWEDWGE